MNIINEKPLVSIIMPIYNASKFLDSAINSLIHQSYKEIEIICVDDGSTDQSVEMINNYQKMDKRILLLQQKNMYAGVARNTGLEKANGEFVIFVDADDIFEVNMIKMLVATVLEKKADMVIFNYYTFSGNKLFRKKQLMKYSGQIKSAKEMKNDVFQMTIGAPWNKFYRMSFVKETGLLFQGTLNSNDIYFTRLTTALCSKIYFLDEKLVNYRVNNVNSLQGNVNKSPVSFAEAFLAIYDEMKRRNLLDYFKNSVEQYAVELCITALDKVRNSTEFKQVYYACQNIVKTVGITEQNQYICDNNYVDLIKAMNNDDLSTVILALFFDYKNNSVPRSSIEYRIGKAVLSKLRIKGY